MRIAPLYLILFAITSFAFYSCKNLSSDPEIAVTKSTVTGRITLDDISLTGVTVKIIAEKNLIAVTNDSGMFALENVPVGMQSIFIHKTIEEYRSIVMETSIHVSGSSTDLGTINFTYPPQAHRIDTSLVTVSNIPISWSKNSETEFLEYKVYRNDTPGFDDSNGLLVFSSKFVNDTTFSDNSFSYGSYNYYRVYVHTLGGKKTGSNIISVRAPEKFNHITNGDFEQSSDGRLPDFFIQSVSGTPFFDYYLTDNSTSKRGKKSLKIYYIDSLSIPHPDHGSGAGLGQKLFTNNMKPGVNYEFSFWTKSQVGSWQIRLYKNEDYQQPLIIYHVPSQHDWTERKFTFNIDSETQSLLVWIYTGGGFHVDGKITGWLDDIQITRL
jgi:hypothetical protein